MALDPLPAGLLITKRGFHPPSLPICFNISGIWAMPSLPEGQYIHGTSQELQLSLQRHEDFPTEITDGGEVLCYLFSPSKFPLRHGEFVGHFRVSRFYFRHLLYHHCAISDFLHSFWLVKLHTMCQHKRERRSLMQIGEI